MIYQWRNGGRGVPAQVAGDRIEVIREQRGLVTPGLVVDDARKKSSPLHPCFDWDDHVAGEKWRIEQARDLLGSLVVVVENDPKAEPVRAFIAIGERNEPNDFMALDTVMGNAELRARALKNALDDFRLLRQRYNRLSELAQVWEAVDRVKVVAPAGLGLAGKRKARHGPARQARRGESRMVRKGMAG